MNSIHGTGPNDGETPADMAAMQNDLLEAARQVREEAGRARRLADTQTQADVIGELKAYAEQLDREAFLFEEQAAEFARQLATTRQLTEEIKELADTARARLQQMADRLKKPE